MFLLPLLPPPAQAAGQIKSLYQLFCGVDATQVEINPLGETSEGKGQNWESVRNPDFPCIRLDVSETAVNS